ncbi:MAG: hypothetical protein EPO28_04840 [Saprospiraceae bacterium]|nr:MAG: hypothetical protein EPO28_04840 [Saprospiraceae bacterium]
MLNKRELFLGIVWIISLPAMFGQTSFSIQGRIGLTAGMSSIKDAGDFSQYFRTRFYYSDNKGIALRLKFSNPLSIEAGYEANNIGLEVIENFYKLLCDTCNEKGGVFNGTGFQFVSIPLRLSYDLKISNRLLFQPTIGLQAGFTNHGYINLAGWGGQGYSLKLTEIKRKSGFALGAQYGGEISWRVTKKATHLQYITLLFLHNVGLLTNHEFTYTSYAENYGTSERIVNFKASYLGATIGYRYFLTKLRE